MMAALAAVGREVRFMADVRRGDVGRGRAAKACRDMPLRRVERLLDHGKAPKTSPPRRRAGIAIPLKVSNRRISNSGFFRWKPRSKIPLSRSWLASRRLMDRRSP